MRYSGQRNDKKTDIVMIVGEFWDDPSTTVLLMMRFLKVNPNEHMGNAKINALYSALSKVMGKKGYEHRRIGGSSGLVQPSPEFFRFVQNQSMTNFPRFGKSIKFIKANGNLKWECYYLGVSDHEVKKTFCCNIQKGGQFSMPSELFTQFPFLQDFLATKAKAALILYQLNGPLKKGKVQPNAVRQELENVRRANGFDWKFLKKELTRSCNRNIGIKKEYVMKHFSTMNKHTVVQHSVGFHLDTVKGQPVLENKVCFKLRSKGDDHGRGGAGEGSFVFALLDWPNKSKVRNAVYRALGGQHVVGHRVTEFNWQAFRAMFNIPEIGENARGGEEAIRDRIAEARQNQEEEIENNPLLRIE